MGLIKALKNRWFFLSFNVPFVRRRRWREWEAWESGDGEGDETFPLANVKMPAMVAYVSPDALFCKGNSLFVDGRCEAGARRSITRELKLVRDTEGFIAVPRDGEVLDVRPVRDELMPDLFFPIING